MNVITKGLTNMEDNTDYNNQQLVQVKQDKKTKTPGLNNNQKLDMNQYYEEAESPEHENDNFQKLNNQPLLLGDYGVADEEEPEEDDS